MSSKHLEPLEQIQECYRVLRKAHSNIVWEILRQSEPFLEWSHYPKGDVYDAETASQYFYHAHAAATSTRNKEHGHFHLFLRKKGIPKTCKPAKIDKSKRPKGSIEEELCHLICIAMNKQGYPIALFTTNRWVTGETWYKASDVIKMLDYFAMDHAYPSWPLNIWLTQMVKHFKPQIIELIKQRDQTIKAWQKKHPDRDVYEDRELEVTSYLPISTEA
ncbi:MAG: hypothetical protein K0R66_475 [Gammaproteobacteria bacterium]|jgi:hypothetical protein|nr:hypothetical protein [Gammaproteobacteria bacterium]